MKNNFSFYLFTLVFLFSVKTFLLADELEINSSKIKFDKKTKITILEGNVSAIDSKNNKIFSDLAKYNKNTKSVETFGNTKIITSEGYELTGENVYFDNIKKVISSNKNTKIMDKDGNEIFVEMFKYLVEKNMFFSKGNIKIKDINNNEYNFSEIYIDEKKNKIVGSDAKIFLNQEDIKISKDNEPRFFANAVTLTNKKNEINKGVFTYCKNRGEDNCPPWILQSKKIEHDVAKKTIYYKNAVLKVYDFPIFYFPFFSHPDPTVKRRSGMLLPSFSDNQNLGPGVSLPYYFAVAKDKDLTLTPKFYSSENPLLLAEYRQDFKNSYLIVDAGHTAGYKNKTDTKSGGSKSHFFSRFNMNFIDQENKSSDLEVKLQKVTNDTYLKVYDINTALVDKDNNILENSLDYNYQNEDLFFGATFSAFDNMTKQDRTKYEYLLPYLTFEKNILTSEKHGVFDFSSNLRVRNYDVNKQTEFFVNDINWKSNKWISDSGLESYFEGQLKTVNYNADNASEYKTDDMSSEVSGVLGYFTKLRLYKNDLVKGNRHLLTPKLLVRYAPGHMRDIDKNKRIYYSDLFNINKINEIDVIENGLSASLGFEYKKNTLDQEGIKGDERLSFSLGQVISERENSDMPSSTSLDQKFSDVHGETRLSIGKNANFNYNFALDQNYNEVNFSEIGGDLVMGNTKFNISYLEEKEHLGDQKYIKSDIEIGINDSNKLSFSTKRDLLTSSAEFYNLSYEYINDCLKAGIVFRREFYTDRDIEPENSIMFTISILPFTNINSPSFNK